MKTSIMFRYILIAVFNAVVFYAIPLSIAF